MEDGGPIRWRAFHLAYYFVKHSSVLPAQSSLFHEESASCTGDGQDTSHRSCSLPVGGGSEDSSRLLLLCGELGELGLGLPSATGRRIGRYSI